MCPLLTAYAASAGPLDLAACAKCRLLDSADRREVRGDEKGPQIPLHLLQGDPQPCHHGKVLNFLVSRGASLQLMSSLRLPLIPYNISLDRPVTNPDPR